MDFGNKVPTNVQDDYKPMPAGWYQAQIQKEEERGTSKGGTQLVYTFKILGQYVNGQLTPAYANRNVWGSYNVICPASPKAEEIAYTEIAKLGQACQLPNVRNSADLVMKTCDIRLDIVQDPGYEPKNEIRGYRACAAQPQPVIMGMPQTSSAAAPVSQQAPASGITPPWGN